jgi:hypothetical protein
MSTDDEATSPQLGGDGSAADGINDLVGELQDVDTGAPDAAANETTISDNNGGRIELGENGSGDNIIRK